MFENVKKNIKYTHIRYYKHILKFLRSFNSNKNKNIMKYCKRVQWAKKVIN